MHPTGANRTSAGGTRGGGERVAYTEASVGDVVTDTSASSLIEQGRDRRPNQAGAARPRSSLNQRGVPRNSRTQLRAGVAAKNMLVTLELRTLSRMNRVARSNTLGTMRRAPSSRSKIT